jgi:hypothetical protein
MSYVVLDTDVASLIFRDHLPHSMRACCLTEGLPLATFNVKDFADFADNNGLVLVGDDRSN